MAALKYYLSVKNTSNTTARLYQEHFIESMAALKYVRKLRMPTEGAMASIRLNCANINQASSKSKIDFKHFQNPYFLEKTLIFDLDDTLIYTSDTSTQGCKFKLPIKTRNGKVTKVRISIPRKEILTFNSLEFTSDHTWRTH